MTILKDCLSKRRAQLVLATGLSSVSALFSIILLGYLTRLAGKADAMPAGALLTGLGFVALMFVSSLIAQTFLAHFGSATVAELRLDLCRRFLRLDYERLLAMGRHQVSGALINDVSKVATLFLVLPLCFFNAMLVLLTFCYLLLLSPALFAVLAGFMTLAIASSMVLMVKSGRNFAAIRDEEDVLFEAFRGIGDGKKELTLNRNRAAHFLQQVLSPSIERGRRLGFQAQRWWNYGGAWSTTMVFCALIAVVFFGRSLFGADQVTVLQFVIGTLFLMNPLNYVIVASQDIAVGLTCARKLESLGLAVADRAEPVVETGTGEWETISARALTHHYVDDDGRGFKLGPIDLDIRRGECLFLVGGNGSGKTTLAMLLTGLLSPLEGHLEVDGCALRPEDLSGYRNRFSTVFFDFYLFRHLLDANGQAATAHSVAPHLHALGLAGKVAVVDGALSTRDLSQGQRRRIALLQVLLEDRDILVFDEWAADQDPEFKQYFYRNLLPELSRRGKTIIAVTHDDRYYQYAHRVLMMEQGKLAESTIQRHAIQTEPA